MNTTISEERLRKLQDQIFPFSETMKIRTFSSDALLENISHLILYPVSLILKLCEIINEQRLTQELSMLLLLEIMIEEKPTNVDGDDKVIQIVDWIKDKNMLFIVAIINSKIDFIWEIYEVVYNDRHHNNKEKFKELVTKYIMMLCALLKFYSTKDKQLILSQEDIADYQFQFTYERPALFLLSLITLRFVDVDFNCLRINKATDIEKKDKWEIESSYENEDFGLSDKNSQDVLFIDGNKVESENYKEILTHLLFEQAEALFSFTKELIEKIQYIPDNLPALACDKLDMFLELLSKINESALYSEFFYFYEDFHKSVYKLPIEIKNPRKYPNTITNITMEIIKKVKIKESNELYPNVEDKLINILEELWQLREVLLRDNKFKDPQVALKFFNEKVKEGAYSNLSPFDPKIFFFKDEDSYNPH